MQGAKVSRYSNGWMQQTRNSNVLAMELCLWMQQTRNSSVLAMELCLWMQQTRNSSVLAMELCLFCINPSTWFYYEI